MPISPDSTAVSTTEPMNDVELAAPALAAQLTDRRGQHRRGHDPGPRPRPRSRGRRRRCGPPTTRPRPRACSAPAGTTSGSGCRRASPRTGSPARAPRRRPSGRGRSHRRRTGVNASSLAWPNGPCPQSCPSAIASVSATFSRHARRDARGHLGDLERVGEARALVVLREHEHLGLARQAPERGGPVQDPVPVPLEARARRVGLLRPRPVAGAAGPRRARRELRVLEVLTRDPVERARSRRSSPRSRRGRAGRSRPRSRPSSRPSRAPAR